MKNASSRIQFVPTLCSVVRAFMVFGLIGTVDLAMADTAKGAFAFQGKVLNPSINPGRPAISDPYWWNRTPIKPSPSYLPISATDGSDGFDGERCGNSPKPSPHKFPFGNPVTSAAGFGENSLAMQLHKIAIAQQREHRFGAPAFMENPLVLAPITARSEKTTHGFTNLIREAPHEQREPAADSKTKPVHVEEIPLPKTGQTYRLETYPSDTKIGYTYEGRPVGVGPEDRYPKQHSKSVVDPDGVQTHYRTKDKSFVHNNPEHAPRAAKETKISTSNESAKTRPSPTRTAEAASQSNAKPSQATSSSARSTEAVKPLRNNVDVEASRGRNPPAAGAGGGGGGKPSTRGKNVD